MRHWGVLRKRSISERATCTCCGSVTSSRCEAHPQPCFDQEVLQHDELTQIRFFSWKTRGRRLEDVDTSRAIPWKTRIQKIILIKYHILLRIRVFHGFLREVFTSSERLPGIFQGTPINLAMRITWLGKLSLKGLHPKMHTWRVMCCNFDGDNPLNFHSPVINDMSLPHGGCKPPFTTQGQSFTPQGICMAENVLPL